MSSIIRRRSGLTVLVSLMGSSILSEVQRHLDSQDGAPQCATAILSTDYRTLGSCPRAAGWSAATSCHGPQRVCRWVVPSPASEGKADNGNLASSDYSTRLRADSDQVRTYPAWRKKFLHSWALKSVTTRPIRRERRGIVCSAALRRCALSLLKASSIGLRSGEYFGR